MPVKIEDETPTGACPVISKDIDILVKEVQERLCLKSREKMRAYRKSPYSPVGQRANVYGNRTSCCKYTSPSNSGNLFRPTLNNCCKASAMSKSEDDSPHILLQKLLKEQTLIQEAVRRLQRKSENENKQVCAWNGSNSLESVSY